MCKAALEGEQHEMTGSEIIIECLKREGVKHVFGYPGGVVLNLFDTLYDDKDIKVILTRHEQGAVHAADGYARASGKPGVVLVTSGPGATNTVTALRRHIWTRFRGGHDRPGADRHDR